MGELLKGLLKKDKKIIPCADGKHEWVIMPEVDIHDAVCDKCGICASDFVADGKVDIGDEEEYWKRIRKITKEAKEKGII